MRQGTLFQIIIQQIKVFNCVQLLLLVLLLLFLLLLFAYNYSTLTQERKQFKFIGNKVNFSTLTIVQPIIQLLLLLLRMKIITPLLFLFNIIHNNLCNSV